ncbi:MAG: type I toxin-antitoxin system SymE family toxin [Oscillospiraceae bacterium]|jgi:toxic protein SymE|nr:type I toxin-antitoxin system SymE family toxin [Oscillospiraceae bacterium]
MKDKKNRRLKVYGQSNGYNYQDVPTIVLKGKWLEAAGFDIGDRVTLECENGRLVITHDNKE